MTELKHVEDSPSGRAWWLLPALAFVVGVVLGAVVVGVGASVGSDAADTTASVTAEPEAPDDEQEPATSPSDVLVRVPGSCLEAADGAEQAAGQIDDVVEAVRALDARRLQELLDEFQQLQPDIQALADRCREVAGEQLEDGGLITPAPAATP